MKSNTTDNVVQLIPPIGTDKYKLYDMCIVQKCDWRIYFTISKTQIMIRSKHVSIARVATRERITLTQALKVDTTPDKLSTIEIAFFWHFKERTQVI